MSQDADAFTLIMKSNGHVTDGDGLNPAFESTLIGMAVGIGLNGSMEAAYMTNEEKATHIRQWIDPEERVTVQFLDVRDLNAQVTDCNNASVTLSIETHVSHMNQHVSFPLSQVEVSEDLSHYTRDPGRPLQRRRLLLLIGENRPPIIY